MKKYKNIIIFVLLYTLLLTSCNTTSPVTDEKDTAGMPDITGTTAAETEADVLAAYLRDNLPLMDGSTSTKPLEAGLRAAILGITLKEAEAQVVHTSTYESFNNLIQNKCDIIFSTPLSKKQYEVAEGSNWHYAVNQVSFTRTYLV